MSKDAARHKAMAELTRALRVSEHAAKRFKRIAADIGAGWRSHPAYLAHQTAQEVLGEIHRSHIPRPQM